MNRTSKRSERNRILTLAAAAAAAAITTTTLPPPDAHADEVWNNAAPSPGNWGTAGNWNGNAVPTSNDHVFFFGNDSLTHLIPLDVPATFQDVQIADQGGGTYVLNQNTNVNVTALQDFEAIASLNGGRGTHNQSAGVNTYASSLQVGAAPGAIGTYNLSGTG